MTALYEIANEYAKLANEDMDPEMIADTLEGIEGEFTDKIEQVLAVAKNELALAEMLKAEAKNLADRAKACQNRAENIKQYIIASMSTMEKTKLNAGIHTITVRKPVQSVHIDDVDSLPPEFVEYETTAKADKNLIKEKLKLGEEVNGASLVLGKPTLLIK
ncbi:MAG: siphovirus Gp157 family protein [Pseudomonadota bacterium]